MKQLIYNSAIMRLLFTMIIFVIYKNIYHNNHKLRDQLHWSMAKRHYLLIPFILILLDEIDNIFLINKYHILTKSYTYQTLDKINDCISYILVPVFFNVNSTLIFFIIYRIIGVILYIITHNNNYLIIFFDFVKEYMLLFYFCNKFNYIHHYYKLILVLCILLKLLFEYYYHKYHNILLFN